MIVKQIPGKMNNKNIVKYLLIVILITVMTCIIFIPDNSVFAQVKEREQIKNPKLEISGELEETQDYFGRKRFIGKVINKEKVPIHFIKIEFTLLDHEGQVLETVNSYIQGRRQIFLDRQISTSTLDAGKTGTFNIIATTKADKVFRIKYKITGKDFIYP
ncbi:hypothetical protein ACFL7D_00130 [candidate division KSB1 bacterium]